MSTLDINRKDLYESLLAEGFLIDEDGHAELSLAEFAERMADEETAITFYENLTEAGFFGDGQTTEEEFLRQICRYHARQDTYPLTENQRGVYIDWDLNREALQYNIPSVQRLDGVDALRLRNAVEAAISAHPYLKTRLTMADGDVRQQPHADEPTVVELMTLDETLPKQGPPLQPVQRPAVSCSSLSGEEQRCSISVPGLPPHGIRWCFSHCPHDRYPSRLSGRDTITRNLYSL